MTQLTATPAEIRAGDTIDWLITLGDYPASSSWVLTYDLLLINAVTAGEIAISSSASGDDHLFAVAKATTAAYTSGDYMYQASVDDATSKFTVETGYIKILPSFVDVASGVDIRSHVKITLDAIQATIQGTATKDQLSYSIQNRSLSRRSMSELLELESLYLRRWRQEQADEDRKNGRTQSGNVYIQMGA